MYPTYFISPLRLSGSAVESLFSQYKFTAGGKLDSVNYTTSRAAHLIKQCATSHHSGVSYRDENLSFIETPLQKNYTIIMPKKHKCIKTCILYYIDPNLVSNLA